MSSADLLSALPAREQRALALLAIPTALMLIGFVIIWPAWKLYRGQTEWRANAVQALAHERGLAEIEKPLHERLDALAQLKSWDRLYRVRTDSDALIALQSDISGLLAASGARAQSFTSLPAVTTGALSKVGVRVTGAMSIDRLRELLQQMTALAHYVRIEKLLITAPLTQSAQENPTLNVTLDVVGFASTTPPRQPAATMPSLAQ